MCQLDKFGRKPRQVISTAIAMSKYFLAALPHILVFEGGYVNHPNDFGNETNFGVVQRTYDAYRTSKDKPKQSVKYINQSEVADIYLHRYWLVAGCDKMPSRLALCVFDHHVNTGRGVELLQTILGCKAVDNSFGKATLNDLTYYLSKHSSNELVGAYMSARRALYVRWAKKPGQEVFLEGWLNRCDHLEKLLNI